MFCVNCGNEIKEEDKFCNNCGAQIQENQTTSMSFRENLRRPHKNRTGLLIGAIIAAGAVLLIVLFVLVSVYRNKANETLDEYNRQHRYENPYTPGTDREYGHYGEHDDYFSGHGNHF